MRHITPTPPEIRIMVQTIEEMRHTLRSELNYLDELLDRQVPSHTDITDYLARSATTHQQIRDQYTARMSPPPDPLRG